MSDDEYAGLSDEDEFKSDEELAREAATPPSLRAIASLSCLLAQVPGLEMEEYREWNLDRAGAITSLRVSGQQIPPDQRLLIDTDFESCLYFVIERDANFDIEADAIFVPGEYVLVCVDHIDHWTKIANALAHYGVNLPEPWGR